MSSLRWTPTALGTFDVWKIVVGGVWIAGETVTLTINDKSCVLTVGTTVTTAAVATDLMQMWNGSSFTDATASASATGNSIPEFAESAATIGATTSTVLFTMKNAGIPMIMSRTLASAAGTITLTNDTVATGPNFFNNAFNWSTGSVPVSTDTVYFDYGSVDVLYGMDQGAVLPAAVYVDLSYTGNIGLPEINETGGYHEYRSPYLSLDPVILKIGRGVGNGSQRLKFNTGADPCALTLYASGTSADSLPAVLWKGTSASNSLVLIGGDLGVAVFGGEVATLATINASGGALLCGLGVTLSGALTNAGATQTFGSAIATSLVQIGGATTINGTGAVAALTVRSGSVTYNTSGTLGGTPIISGDGVLDFSGNAIATTVSGTINLYGQTCFLNDVNKRLGAFSFNLNEGATLAQVNMGMNTKWTRGTPP